MKTLTPILLTPILLTAVLLPLSASAVGTYTVSKGETLWSISRKYNVSVADLQHRNGLKSHLIRIGQVLTIDKKSPKTSSYLVKKGDTLYKIAHRFGIKLSDLQRWNDLKDPDRLFVGTRLRLKAQKPSKSVPKLELQPDLPVPKPVRDLPEFKIRKVILEQETILKNLADHHGVTAQQLREQNGWEPADLADDALLAAGCEVDIPTS